MNYLKIVEIAHKCEVNRQRIVGCYKLLGANPAFTDKMKEVIHLEIKQMEDYTDKMRKQLQKLIK